MVEPIISIVQASALSCSILSTSSVTGATNSWNFTFNPLVPILVGQVLQIIIPLWGVNNSSNFVNSTPICSGMTCSVSTSNGS